MLSSELKPLVLDALVSFARLCSCVFMCALCVCVCVCLCVFVCMYAACFCAMVLSQVFLRYLHKWIDRYWLHSDSVLKTTLKGARLPSFYQVSLPLSLSA